MMDRTSQRPAVTELPKSPASPDGTGQLAGRQPLLQFDPNGDLRPSPERARARISKSRSVFGVDQIWEREMAKVKIIQEQQARNEVELNRTKRTKDKGKGKAIPPILVVASQSIDLNHSMTASFLSGISPIKYAPDQPPKLQYSPVMSKGPTMTEDISREVAPSQLGIQSWFGSGDEESDLEVARPRTLDKGKGRAESLPLSEVIDDSEDDQPLSKLALDVEQPESSEENVPLSTLAKSLARTTLSRSRNSSNQTGQQSIDGVTTLELVGARDYPGGPSQEQNDFEDDDVPLLLRKSHSSSKIIQDEDDLPLGQRYATAAQQQTLAMAQARFAETYWEYEMEAARQASMTGWNPSMVMGLPFPPALNWGAIPYMGYTGYPSQPYFECPPHPPHTTRPIGLMGHESPASVTSGGPEKAIDNWRKDVFVAPETRGNTKLEPGGTV